MKRTLWTLLLALGMMLALCVGAGAETTENDFFQALSMGNPVQLENDFSYSGLLYVYSSLTIDLNGHVLEIPDGIYVAQGARLTIKDSNPSTPHNFSTPNASGRWEWDKTGTETTNMRTVYGGVITGGTGKQDPDHPTSGGGVYVAPGGTLTMEGGSIAGCSAGYGGGVYVSDTFTMSENAVIIGCAAGADGGGDSEPSWSVSAPDRVEHGSVSVSPSRAQRGAAVTVTVKPDGGYTLETLTVTDGKGAELTLTDKGGGKFTFVIPAGAVKVTASFMEDNSVLNFFYDVPNDAYYYEAVKWAVENGITSGRTDGRFDSGGFSPNAACTRAQIVTFLYRSAK